MSIENNPDTVPTAEPREIEVPASTAWPMIMALGLMLTFAGLVTSVVTSAVGVVLFFAGAIGWFREVLPYEHRETVAVQPAPAVVTAHRVGVDYLRVGEPHEEILRQYPTLGPQDIDAALGYAAWLAHEEEEHPLHTEVRG